LEKFSEIHHLDKLNKTFEKTNEKKKNEK